MPNRYDLEPAAPQGGAQLLEVPAGGGGRGQAALQGTAHADRAAPQERGLAGRPAQVRQQPPQEVQQQRHGRTPAGTLLAPALGGGRANQQPGAGREAPSANREKAVRRAEPIGGRGRAVRAGGVGMEARLNAAAQGAAMSGAARQAPGGADFGGPSDFGCMRPAGGVPQRAGGGKRLSLNSGH